MEEYHTIKVLNRPSARFEEKPLKIQERENKRKQEKRQRKMEKLVEHSLVGNRRPCIQ